MSSMVRVAQAANVAISTVSLTLNHRERVKPATAERVEDAMRRVGYRPREKRIEVTGDKASAIRVAFIYTLESLTPVEDPTMTSYCREIISGMQEFLAGSASFLSIFRGVDHADHDVMVNEQINAKEFDGVILLGAEAQNGYLKRLQRSGLPMVVLNRLPVHGRFSCVTVDYYGGARQAIEHLHALGHRRIAAATKDDSGKWLASELCDGTRDALEEAGLEPVIDLSKHNLQSIDGLKRLCKAVVSQKVTAIFAGDPYALRCTDILEEMGVNVPEQVSIVGFDDRGLTTGNGRRLSSIGYDKNRMGRMAIQMLQRLCATKAKVRWLSGAVTTHLVGGQTAAEVANDEG